jgi:hypothetical protein
MINVLKEFWFKWRRQSLLRKVETLGYERVYLKDKQIELKQKASEYLEKTRELKRLTNQD